MCKNLCERGRMKRAFSKVLFSFLVLLYPVDVSAQGEDTMPPTIQSLDFTPKAVDVSDGPQSITVTTRITDNLSGYNWGWFGFQSPTGTQGAGAYVYGGARISGDSNDGVYQFQVYIPQFSETGDWHVPNFQIYDSTGNFGNYSGAYLATLGFPTTLSVTENQNPVADAGLDKGAIVAEQVHFDGSNSSDPDGYIATWVWDFGDGSPTGSGTLVSHSYAQAGQFTVKLTVYDNDGTSAVDQVLVDVKAPITVVDDLIADVNSSISGGLQKSLVSKLSGAISSLKRENYVAAINKLNLFVEEVLAQQGKNIPPDIGDQWIGLAERIIGALQAGAPIR